MRDIELHSAYGEHYINGHEEEGRLGFTAGFIFGLFASAIYPVIFGG